MGISYSLLYIKTGKKRAVLIDDDHCEKEGPSKEERRTRLAYRMGEGGVRGVLNKA